MPATQAIIHFIGIILFTTQPVLIPDQMQTQVNQRTSIKSGRQLSIKGTKVVAILPRVPATVEPHTALIAFRACDYLGSTGWNPTDLGRDGLLYVELNHDTISFQTSATTNRAINPPTTLPHLNDSLASPHNLQAGYTPTTGYSSAAGVIDMPVGTLSVCGMNVGGPLPRVDTEVSLDTNGPLVIVSGSKKLTLTANAHFSIGNVPLAFAKTHQADDPSMAEHYNAYCAMADGTVTTCNKPVIPSVPPCTSDAANMRVIVPQTNLAMSFQCSNTQYP